MNTLNIADIIENTDAAGVLTNTDYHSYCRGSDQLVELGLMNNDGELSDVGREVKLVLELRANAGDGK